VLVVGLKSTNGLSEVTVPHTVLVLKLRDDVTFSSVPFTIWKSSRLLNVAGSFTVRAWKIGIPLTKSGRERKVGAALGPLVPVGLLLMLGARLFGSRRR